MNDKVFIELFKVALYEAIAKELVALNSSDIIEWITVKGNHIPIKKGQTKEQAIKEFIESKHVPSGDSIGEKIKKVAKDIYKSYKEANCESTEPAYQYPKSIAGAKRGKPMTFEEADNGRANPYFHRDNYAYSHNCQSCVVAHEARLRGYNVQAAPRRRNNKTQELAEHSSWAWIDPKTGKKCESTRINVSNAKEHFNYLEQNIKPGERYQSTYYWKNKKNNKILNHGHVISIARNKYGELQMYDPQINAIYTGKNIEKYFNNPRIIFSETHLKPKILRVDDKNFNPYFMNDVLKKY